MILWHINHDIETVVKVPIDISDMLVFEALSEANEPIVKLLHRPHQKPLLSLSEPPCLVEQRHGN